jgi:hypothetical protein
MYNITRNQWTWISGDNAANFPGSYSSKGVPSTASSPGRHAHSMTIHPTMNLIYVFAGLGSLQSGTGELNVSDA